MGLLLSILPGGNLAQRQERIKMLTVHDKRCVDITIDEIGHDQALQPIDLLRRQSTSMRGDHSQRLQEITALLGRAME